MIELKETATEYLLFIPFALNYRAKRIQGRRWDGVRKCWVYPKNPSVYAALFAELREELAPSTAAPSQLSSKANDQAPVPATSKPLSIVQLPTAQQLAAKLDRLAELKQRDQSVQAEYESRRAEVLKAVQAELDALEGEYAPLLQESSEAASKLEIEIRNEVLLYGASVKTNQVQALYYKGRVSWDTDGLVAYAANNPNILQFRRVGKPTVSVRIVR